MKCPICAIDSEQQINSFWPGFYLSNGEKEILQYLCEGENPTEKDLSTQKFEEVHQGKSSITDV